MKGVLKSICASGLRKLEDTLIREKLCNQIHCIENDQSAIIFIKNSITILSCQKLLKRALEQFLRGCSRLETCKKFSIEAPAFENFLHGLFQKIDSKAEQTFQDGPHNVLDRLVLNISNDCNLKCKYCYAGGGTYGGTRALMNREIALAAIDKFYSIFGAIEKIQFFGGEPLLNPGLIGFVCHELTERYNKGRINKLPILSLVTNGTILSTQVLEILKNYNLNVTISMDGPQRVTDYLRGNGTTAKIGNFISQLQKLNLDYSFEGTFTAHHLEVGLSLKDILNFFFEHFQQQQVHVPLAMLPPDDPLLLNKVAASEIYRQAVEYSMENMKNNNSACLSFATRIADAFVKKEPIRNYCPAGRGTLSVDVEGNVSPCFMFTGIKGFQLGNVRDGLFPQNPEVARIYRTLIENDKTHDPVCLNCWASPFCTGCLGGDYVSSGGSLAKTNCDVMKAMVEGFLTKAAALTTQQREAVALQ